MTSETGPLKGILVVDDDDGARRLLITYLTHKGYPVMEAVDGTDALEMVAREAPDLVLLDVMMPGMTGLQVLQNLRERYHTAELPVILLTALGDTADIVRGLELGANDYLTKPVEVAELAARVRNQLRLKRLHDQYRAGLEHLQELDELKDKFLQIAAHDLKSPLGTITMGLQILSDAVPDVCEVIPEYERVLNMMMFAGTVMQSIIDDYLDLQTIKAGKLVLEMQSVSLNQQIKAVVEQYQAYAESKEIKLVADFDESLRLCPGDPDRLTQVISNLISNAIKFSGRNTRVTVRTIKRDGTAVVEITDQGPGISDAEIPLLFEEFSRLTNKPTGGEKSSGVGLAISRYLVEAHGGQIGADSVIGQGSTFWFHIPC